MSKTIAMIPARMGSQRLKKKNLCELEGVPLITRAIRKCKEANCFDEIWVNSENVEFKAIAEQEGVNFHKRPEALGNNNATSEQFVAEFLQSHECEYLLQVHSIAPLLSTSEVESFTKEFVASEADVFLSCIEDQIEVSYQNVPVNFTFNEKTNSQDLKPLQRITWSITGWKRETYLQAIADGKCATYTGNVMFFAVDPISGHVIKTQQDLDIAEALLKVLKK
ncbi:cytidylyltransferase domain-containing protein [Pseudoalteromonas spongiae]|uniref:NTP transferase domain-containing protein n=1 Tax=Pseudoalteromonas spongiae TaxID=298657 RepID=A0ABU8EQG4_9GAMM